MNEDLEIDIVGNNLFLGVVWMGRDLKLGFRGRFGLDSSLGSNCIFRNLFLIFRFL